MLNIPILLFLQSFTRPAKEDHASQRKPTCPVAQHSGYCTFTVAELYFGHKRSFTAFGTHIQIKYAAVWVNDRRVKTAIGFDKSSFAIRALPIA